MDGFWTAMAWFGGAAVGLSGAFVAWIVRRDRMIAQAAVAAHIDRVHADQVADHEARLRALETSVSNTSARVERLCEVVARIETNVTKISDHINDLPDKIDKKVRTLRAELERRQE